jgi:hypothetical protein
LRRLAKFFALSPQERTVFLTALLLLPATRLSLAVWDFKRTSRWLGRLSVAPARPTDQPTNEPSVERTMMLVRAAAAAGVCRTTCLPRSLVLLALLRRHGANALLRIGARKQAGCMEAHAWVEVGSQRLDPSSAQDKDFVPLAVAGSFGRSERGLA